MPEAFVPFVAPANSSAAPSFSTLGFPATSAAPAPPPSAVPATHAAGAEPCSKPVVTLQRNGDTVTGIRVQCGCGQVIDLKCVF